MRKNIAILLTSLFLMSGTVVFAQPQNVQGRPLYQEFKAYYEENVKPVLLEQQEKFMGVLTDEEKTQLEQIKQQWKTVHESMKGKVPPEDRKSTQKAHFEAFNSQVEKIADAHPAEKEEYIKTMSAKKEQWMKDIQDIRAKYDLPENKNMRFYNRVDDPAFILMWDPNKMYSRKPMNKNMMSQQKVKAKKAMQPGITIFPQPAKATVTVRITGMLNKKVEAGVYNANGKKVKDLFDATSSLQVLSFTLDVSGWDNGIYTVKTKFDDRNMTMDFKVEK